MYTIPKANLIAVILECILFGIYTVLFCISVAVLTWARRSDRINYALLIPSILIWVLACAHMSLDIARLVEAFIDSPVPLMYYAQINEVKFVVSAGLYATETAIADALIVYRVWVVWGRDWRVIVLPALLVAGNAVAGYGFTYSVKQAVITDSALLAQFAAWVKAFLILTLTSNALSTLLIAGRIWWQNNKMSKHRTAAAGNLMPIVAIVVESGVLYVVVLSLALALYITGSPALYTVLDSVASVIGITFSLILVRVGLGISQSNTNRLPSATSNPGAASALRFTQNRSRVGQTETDTMVPAYPMKSLAVNVEVQRYVDDNDSQNDMKREHWNSV